MRILAIGDHFIPAEAYAAAYAELGGAAEAVRSVAWAGDKAEQHAAQQVMEKSGPGAVREPAEIVAAVADAEVLALHFAAVPAAVLRAGPDLRAVCVARTGLENVDVRAATEAGIAVVPVYGRNASGVAELAIGLMLAESRDIVRADASVKAGGWRKDFGPKRPEVGGSTVGVIGLGQVARQFAPRVRGFGVRLIGYDPYVDDETFAEYGVERVDLDTVYAESDFVHLMARLTDETRRFVTAERFRSMKPTAYFINTARSRLVDTDAFHTALAEGWIAGGASDVWDDEPLAADSGWRSLENVTITTHFAGDTQTTDRRSARLVAEAIRELEATGRIGSAINAAELGWTGRS